MKSLLFEKTLDGLVLSLGISFLFVSLCCVEYIISIKYWKTSWGNESNKLKLTIFHQFVILTQKLVNFSNFQETPRLFQNSWTDEQDSPHSKRVINEARRGVRQIFKEIICKYSIACQSWSKCPTKALDHYLTGWETFISSTFRCVCHILIHFPTISTKLLTIWAPHPPPPPPLLLTNVSNLQTRLYA
jgi:hypothetical protein